LHRDCGSGTLQPAREGGASHIFRAPAAAVVASHDGGLTVFVAKDRGEVTGTRVSVIETDYSKGAVADAAKRGEDEL
jgi:hypothetical protein